MELKKPIIQMRYFEQSDKKFIENGKSLVRVHLITRKPSDISPGRTLKIFEVCEVMRTHDKNPIVVGNHLALSFPNEKLNAKEYKWYTEGWEEAQCPVTISDRAIARNLLGRQ